MIAAGLLIAGKQHIVGGIEEDSLHLIAQRAHLAQQIDDIFRIEEAAAAHICREGNRRIAQAGIDKGLHHPLNQHGRQIVNAENTQVLQVADGRRLAGAAHTCQQQKPHPSTSCAFSPMILTSGSSTMPVAAATVSRT